jgi:curved DNA-binding protein CbpA
MTPDEVARIRQWLEVARHATYYEVLDVAPDASPGEIQASYHRYALAFHPDNHPRAPPGTQRVLSHLFQLGAEAYRVLSTESRRGAYDAALERGQLRLPRSIAPDVGARDPDAIGKSPAARLHTRRASELTREGRLQEARRALVEALTLDDYENLEIDDWIQEIDQAIARS